MAVSDTVPDDLRPELPYRLYAFGFSLRKRAILRRFLPDRDIRFVSSGEALPPGATLLLWGGEQLPPGSPADVRTVRLEDGFLRSVGLGADLVQPLSWVIDQRGIYFDAGCESDLEQLLGTAVFAPQLVQRASELRQRITSSGLTKYNVGAGQWQRPTEAPVVILVPGQVESDASIRLGAPGICTNLELLRAVRHTNPEAYVVYKPHPDVVAGLRARGRGEDEVRAWCNAVVTDVGMADLLAQVDEVHTLTSLAGFEALLRGLKVSCYGLPFYAGWGLTSDSLACPRRTRRLALDELVAGALILYPRYVSRQNPGLVSPEQALSELLSWRAEAARPAPWRVGARGLLRVMSWIRGKS